MEKKGRNEETAIFIYLDFFFDSYLNPEASNPFAS